MRIIAIEKIQKDPRGPSHWAYTNEFLDYVLRKTLPNSPLIQYAPQDWMHELTFAFSELKMHYWLNFRVLMFDPDYRHMLQFPLWGTRNVVIPYYLRLIALCLQILCTRCNEGPVRDLPCLPDNWRLTRVYPDILFFFDHEKHILEYLDTVTNGATALISAFFTEASGITQGKGVNIQEGIVFPIPISDLFEYVQLNNHLLEIYTQSFQVGQKRLAKEHGSWMKENISPQLDRIYERAAPVMEAMHQKWEKEFHKIFTSDPVYAHNQNSRCKFSISKEALEKLQEISPQVDADLRQFMDQFREIFDEEDPVDRPQKVRYITLYEHLDLDFLRQPSFGEKMLVPIVDFLCVIHAKYATPKESLSFQKLCEIYKFFLQKYPFVVDGELCENKADLERDFATQNFDPASLSRLLSKEGEVDFTDIANAPALFKHAGTVFERPLLQDKGGRVHFSIPLLFDALLYRFEQELQRKYKGAKRAHKAENYIAYLLENFLQQNYPQEHLPKPSKLIIRNPTRYENDKNYQELARFLPSFRYPEEIIECTDDVIGTPFSYFEFDLVIPFRDVLVVIEVKDDLFYEVKDLPGPFILWVKAEKEKLLSHVQNLHNPIIRKDLEMRGIKFSRIESIVVTQGHIYDENCDTIKILFQRLEKIYLGDQAGVTLVHPSFPPYPF